MSNLVADSPEGVRLRVRDRYGKAAVRVLEGRTGGCCGATTAASCCGGDTVDPITGDLYSAEEASEVPADAIAASLGCGNPTFLAQLLPGQTVLDLGSGGGIDVLLSARRVGPTGFAYGLDMTDQMLALAERNKTAAGAENVRFLKGQIESIPLPDNTVDVIISNCVINLSADKDAVLREAFRVLKPGGRLAVSDVVVDGVLPDVIRRDMEAYVGCIAGALERTDYLSKLASAGFVHADIEPTRRYQFSDMETAGCCSAKTAALPENEKEELNGRVMSAFIRAEKPGGVA